MTDTPPRSLPWATINACIGTAAIVLGVALTIGQWRGQSEEFDRRLTKVEEVQRTNLPTFYRMTENLAYLAERAKREDERLHRQQEQGR
jgi:hypothetical protein